MAVQLFIIFVWCVHLWASASTDADVTKHANWNLLDHEQCGMSWSDRIIGGTRASLGQFPWLVRLGYSAGGAKDFVSFKCGGALINPFYVVTAAHCVANLPRYSRLSVVRLGEFLVDTDIDCEDGVCAPEVQDIKPAKIIIHKHYQTPPYKHDIALVRLKKAATMNGFVSPICFPHGSLMTREWVGSTMEVAGWGIMSMRLYKQSPYPLFVRLPVIDLDQCNTTYKDFTSVGPGQLCAGGKVGFDSCGGDSGGPLMKVEAEGGPPRYYIFGLVSFGSKECGSDSPAVYTDFAKYEKWVLDNMEP